MKSSFSTCRKNRIIFRHTAICSIILTYLKENFNSFLYFFSKMYIFLLKTGTFYHSALYSPLKCSPLYLNELITARSLCGYANRFLRYLVANSSECSSKRFFAIAYLFHIFSHPNHAVGVDEIRNWLRYVLSPSGLYVINTKCCMLSSRRIYTLARDTIRDYVAITYNAQAR